MAKKAKNPLYTHILSGQVFELVKTKPITLIPAFASGRSFGDARRPTKVTFGRDYQRVIEH